MQQSQASGHEQIFTELIRNVLDTVGIKPGLSADRKASAQNAIVCSVMAFNPRDPVETTMAGHCVIYDHMLRAGAKGMLGGTSADVMTQTGPGVLAAGKMYLNTLAMLRRVQARPAAELAFARPIPVAAREEPAKLPEAAPVAAAEPPSDPVPPEAQPTDPAPVSQVAPPPVPAQSPRSFNRIPDRRVPHLPDMTDPKVFDEVSKAALTRVQETT